MNRPLSRARNLCAQLSRDLSHEVARVLLPTRCVLCGLADAAVCHDCVRGLECRPAVRSLPGLRVYSTTAYTAQVRALIAAVKEFGRTDALPVLADLLAAALVALCEAELGTAEGAERAGSGIHQFGRDIPDRGARLPVVLVPVPSRAASRRQRGFSHTALLAQRALRRIEHSDLARRGQLAQPGHRQCSIWGEQPPQIRELLWVAPESGRRDQVGLSKEERARNVQHSVRCSERARGRAVVLIDDLVTTGASVQECARALNEGGATVLGAASCAFTESAHGEG